jgi:hypothetical protein
VAATTSPGSREIETKRKAFSSAGTDHGSLDRGILRTAKLGGNDLAVLLIDRGARPPRAVASGSVRGGHAVTYDQESFAVSGSAHGRPHGTPCPLGGARRVQAATVRPS